MCVCETAVDVCVASWGRRRGRERQRRSAVQSMMGEMEIKGVKERRKEGDERRPKRDKEEEEEEEDGGKGRK